MAGRSTRSLVGMVQDMRPTAILVAAIAALYSPFQNAVESPVMLDDPGVLEAIRKNDPERFRQLAAVLATAHDLGCGEKLRKVLETRFGAVAASCAGYALATEPPKARLIFRLGEKRYSTIFVPRNTSKGRADAD